MSTFLAIAAALLTILALGLTVGRALAEHLAEHPYEMTDERLQEESYWEAAIGHFPNRYSRELDRRSRA